ncbi:MAG: hypothetical protein ABSB49_19795 [Polyangia bacterium]|jgi:hypothetical protein
MRPGKGAPAIIPTITQRVRSFLAGQGATLRPWSGLQETYDELYVLLRRRRNDPEFWHPLKTLLQDVVDSAAESQRCGSPQTELLASWRVDELVDELHATLSAETAGFARSDFTRKLSGAVLGGFLLLGLAAAGCGSDTGTSAIDTGAGTVDSAPVDAGVLYPTGQDAATACTQAVAAELDQAIGESNLNASDKSSLCQCFAALSTGWTTSLTQLFATATPAEISTMLGSLTSCCEPTGIPQRDLASSAPSSTDLSEIKGGYTLCAIPVYKGVSFPD